MVKFRQIMEIRHKERANRKSEGSGVKNSTEKKGQEIFKELISSIEIDNFVI